MAPQNTLNLKHIAKDEEVRAKMSMGTLVSILTIAGSSIFAFANLQAKVSSNEGAIIALQKDKDALAQHVWENKEATDANFKSLLAQMNDHNNQVDQRLARIEAGIDYLKSQRH